MKKSSKIIDKQIKILNGFLSVFEKIVENLTFEIQKNKEAIKEVEENIKTAEHTINRVNKIIKQ